MNRPRVFPDGCVLMERMVAPWSASQGVPPERPRVDRIPHESQEEFRQARALIRHTNDAPVLAAALKAAPDWVLTDNTAHFSAEVSARTGLRIATPEEFLRQAGRLFGGPGRAG